MTFLRIESKWEESVCLPGSILIEGSRVFMNAASIIPRLAQSCSEARMVMSSLRK